MPALKFLTPLSFVESAKLSDLEAEETAVKVDEVSNGIGTDVTIILPAGPYRYTSDLWGFDRGKLVKTEELSGGADEPSAAGVDQSAASSAQAARAERFKKADKEYYDTWKEHQEAAAEERSRARRTAGVVPELMLTVEAARSRLTALEERLNWKMRSRFQQAEYSELDGRGHRGWVESEEAEPGILEEPRGAHRPPPKPTGRRTATLKAKPRRSRRSQDNDQCIDPE